MFEILALCVGSAFCVEPIVAHALTAIVGVVGLTLLLVAGYGHHEERVGGFTPSLPLFSVAVLVCVGVVLGLF